MCFLLSLVVICLFIIRKDKFWLQEVLLAVNNAIKSKSEVPALHRADLYGAAGSTLCLGPCLPPTRWSGHGDRFLAEHTQVLSYNCSSLVSWGFAQICVPPFPSSLAQRDTSTLAIGCCRVRRRLMVWGGGWCPGLRRL